MDVFLAAVSANVWHESRRSTTVSLPTAGKHFLLSSTGKMSEIQQPGKICGRSGFCGLRKFSGRSKWRGLDVPGFGQSGLFKAPH